MCVFVLGYPVTKLELLVYVGIVSRLIFYLLWDSLHLVDARKLASRTIYDCLVYCYVELCEVCFLLITSANRTAKRGLLYLFGTDDIWLRMEDISKSFMCGDGGARRSLGRVHLDRACVVLSADNNPQDVYQVFSQISECYGCRPQEVWRTTKMTSAVGENITGDNSFQVDTRYSTFLELYKNNDSSPLCTAQYHFGQFGLYNFSLKNCTISVEEKPSNPDIPIFWAFVVLCFLAGFRLTYQAIYKTSAFRKFLVWLSLRTEVQNDLTSQFSDRLALIEVTTEETKRSRRLRSLDAFRGLSISVMIFVNYGGGSYYFFNHSAWNGLTVADLVFPWFIWIMGVSLVISIQSQLRNSIPRIRILRKVLIRSTFLVLLGLVLNSDGGKNDLRTLRIPGVLQRFGLSYLLVGFLEALLTPREFLTSENRGRFGCFMDFKTAGWQWFFILIIGGLHTAITFLLPVPGCPTGYLGPGGLADNGSYPNCTGGAAMWVDVSIFGADHIYQYPTSRQVYAGSTPHDPEGLLGTLNSVVLVWLGVAAGRILLVHTTWQGRAKRWICFGLLTGLIAGCLCGFSKDEGVIPVNKNLWSLSFVLVTGSFAFILLTVMYLLIDVFKFWSASPFHFAGMNSIVLYIGHEMVGGMLPWSWKPFSESHAEELAMNLWGAGLWVFTAYLLYKKRIFLAL